MLNMISPNLFVTVRLYLSLSHVTSAHVCFFQRKHWGFVNHINYFLEKTVTIGMTWTELRKTLQQSQPGWGTRDTHG